MITFNASEWSFHQLEKEEMRSCQIEIAGAVNAVSIDVRCPSPVTLNAVMADGRTLYLDWGSVISFSAKMVGFVAFEVLTDKSFMYRCNQRSRWFEVPDQTKMVVDIDESANKPITDLITEEVRKYIGRAEAAGVLGDDISIAEFLDDVENGDLEFEEEPDPFGLGYEERLAEFKAMQAQEAREAAEEVEATPLAEQPSEPRSGSPSASGKAKPGASGPSTQSDEA